MRYAPSKNNREKISSQRAVPRAQKTTRKAADTVQQLIDKAPTAIFIFQGEKNVFVNSAAEQLTGYRRQELLQMDFWGIVHPDYRMMVNQRGRARQRGVKVPARYEVKIIRKDGAERWLDYLGAAITWRGKAAVIGTTIDITERKHGEDKLRRHLTQLQALHETIVATSSNLDLANVLDVLLEKIDSFLAVPMVGVIRVRNNQTGDPQAMALRNVSEEEWLKFIPRGGSGLSRAVLETRATVMTVDAITDRRVRHPEFFRQLGLASYLGLPLTIGDKVVGDIGLFTKERHEFSEDQITFISTLASQAAIAIHNSQLYEQTKRRSDELTALNEITQAATRSLELGGVLREAVQAIARIAHFDGVRIHIFDEVAQVAHLQATFDSEPGLWPPIKTVSRGVGIVGKVAESGEPAIFEDVRTDARYAQLSHTSGAKKADGRFFGVFPIQTKIKSWGTLSCMAKQARTLKVEDIDLIVQMCDRVAVLIENVTLLESTVEKTKELSTLYSTVGDCMRFLDINTLLYQTMRRVLDIFGFDAARIYLRDESRDGLNLIVHEGFEPSIRLPERYDIGQGLIGFVAQSGECLVFDDMQNNAEYLRLAGTKIMWRGGYRGSFLMPLKAREGTIGVMNFVSKNSYPFKPGEIERIKAIAYHLGIAVGNARLFGQLTRRTRELEKANKAKDEFLGVISHELRTPLNVILGYMDFMKQNSTGDLSPQGQAIVAKVAGQAKVLSSLVESILVTTNIEAGMVELVATELNLAECFIQLRSFYEAAGTKDVKLIWDIPIDLPVIKTDGLKLQRILQNLIDNAIKFTDEGSVTVSARVLADENKVNFTVRDTGVGIARADISRIFDIFTQVDSSTTRSHEGVGLGLYIVRKLSELLNGSVEVQSEPGKGSAFTVAIPLNN